MRSLLITIAEALALLVLLPFYLWSRLPFGIMTRFTAPSQVLALVPGLTGVLLRRVWYRLTLKRCGTNLTVDWLAVIRTPDTEIGDRCTLGVANWIGWANIGDDVMTGSHVVVTSGAGQHDFSDLSRPMRDQGGAKRQVVIGNDVWIGAGAIVMANVSQGTVIGAGSVVTKTYEPSHVIAGNPARILKARARP